MKLATLLSVSLLASAAAFAETSATSANVIGVLRVDSSAKRTIVAVPWVAAGVAAGDIKVTDLVKTSNLTEGDELHYYKGNGSFDSWSLDAQKSWQPANQVTENGNSEKSDSPEVQCLARGGALILIRKTPGACFYLCGQATDVAAGATNLGGAGTKAAPVYSLIAPPKAQAAEIDVNGAATWTGIGDNDMLRIETASGVVACKWTSSGWKSLEETKNDDLITQSWTGEAPKLVPGTGCWFVSQTSGATSPSVQWK